ncbi:MAG: glycine--tRNA ligase [bacterium]
MENVSMEQLISLCKRRGFVYPSSEIYGGMAGIYDYGHYGVLLKDNIKNLWVTHMAQYREDVYLLDSAIFMHPKTWVASGHVDGFNDPQVDCKNCKARFRADHILEDFGIQADKASIEFINTELDTLRDAKKLVCPNCNKATLTEARVFSMMVKSNLGSPVDTLSEENVVYLRPETCGGIYLEYKNTLDSLHPKMPFGIAQVGKAFRNEIAARQFIFRTREFEQMEMQYFHHKNDTQSIFDMWKETRMSWYKNLGIADTKLHFYKHEKLAHYASDAYDIEYNFASLGGFKEVEGIHARGDWDLSQHSKHSGVALDYFDEEKKERYIPHIVETSAGLARQFLMVLDNAYTEVVDEKGETRTFLKLPYAIAPVKCAIFPLLKNKPELVGKAREIYLELRKSVFCEFDDNGNIGKRYRRQDEIGTPWCIVVDFDTLGENPELLDTVTIRHRDTGAQERVAIQDIVNYIQK